MNFEKIVNTLVSLKEEDEKIDNAFIKFLNIISPSQYSPFIEFNGLSGYLKGIEVVNKFLADELSYYIYEAYKMKDGGEITTEEGKKYKIKTKEDMIDYLEKEFII